MCRLLLLAIAAALAPQAVFADDDLALLQRTGVRRPGAAAPDELTLYRSFVKRTVDAMRSPHIFAVSVETFRGGFAGDLPAAGAAVFVLDDAHHSTCQSASDTSQMLKNSLVKVVASENWIDGAHPKVVQMPIGFESKLMEGSGGYAGESAGEARRLFTSMSKQPPEAKARRHLLMDDSHLSTYSSPRSGYRDDRGELLLSHARNAVDDWYIAPVTYIENMHRVSDAQLSICPEGNGLDTHRFYEHYALGTRCIIRDGPLTPLHARFPGTVVVKDWNEINATNIETWLQQSVAPHRPELLTAAYWIAEALRPVSRILVPAELLSIKRLSDSIVKAVPGNRLREAMISELEQGHLVLALTAPVAVHRLGDEGAVQEAMRLALLQEPLDVRVGTDGVLAVPNNDALALLRRAPGLEASSLRAAASSVETVVRFGSLQSLW